MVYRFKLVSDEVNNFSREIEIDSENTFLQFRNAILESVDYTKDELDSFFLCDEEWNREEEITLEDMGTSSSDTDLWLMEDTPLSELIEEEGQKLIFEYDYLTQRSFFMELKEIIPNRRLTDPMCTMKRGKAPKQSVDLAAFEKKVDLAAQKKVEDFDDIEMYSADDFNDEELSEGFSEMEM
ncbi:MAG: hypothetical protein K2M13_06580 [Muribaculaceae bacterium]|nr:hypothetical protein [Muribaculaceae bacterium]